MANFGVEFFGNNLANLIIDTVFAVVLSLASGILIRPQLLIEWIGLSVQINHYPADKCYQN